MPKPAPAAFALPTALLLAVLAGEATAPAAFAAPETAAADAKTAGMPLPAALAKAHALSKELTQALGGDTTPASNITAVSTDTKLAYAPRADGAWLFKAGQGVPGQDTLILILKTKVGGPRLRLDFLTDPSLPTGGAGLCPGNGNFCLSGVSVSVAGKPITITAAISTTWSEDFKPANLLKPASDPSSHEWNAAAHTGGARRLDLDLAASIPAGAEVTVRLEAKTRWTQHVPGCVSAACVGGEKAGKAAEKLGALKKEFNAWRGQTAGKGMALSGGRSGLSPDSAILAQSEFLRAASEAQVWSVLQKKDGHAFLSTFVTDQAWLESFLLGGQEGTTRCDYAQSLENLRLLYSQLPRNTWADPVSKRLATAMALQAGAMNRYRFVERFHLIEKARAEGKLHAGFDQLDVRAMRHAINLGGSPFEFNAWLDETQFTAGGYLGACWAVPYTDPSTYGYSIQGWGFHDPLRHAYSSAKLWRSIGGVCGTLSTFGANSALAHGVPAFTVGQPQHCAYVLRLGDSWATGNDVSGPHTNSWSAYEGLGFTSTNALLEKTENAKEYVKAQRLLWAARAQHAAGPQGASVQQWKASYETALAAQPTNLAVWSEYLKWLEIQDSPYAIVPTPPADWLSLAHRTATSFKEHQEAGWSLATRCLQNGKAQLKTPAERAAKLLELHAILSQKAVPTMYGYDIGRFLSWQADFIGDDAQTVDFFGKLLALHHSDNPGLNWVFGNVLGWGANYFAARPAASGAYAKAIGDFFASQGDKADKGQAAGMISAGLRKASEAGDFATYSTWQNLAKKLLPPVTPGDVYLNPQQVTARPKAEAFPDTLLSATGMLRTSSQAASDRPLSYGQVLGGGELGFFDTANEAKPWAQVVLAGEGELSGIVLVDRYEFAPEQAWDVPLKVETSTDGKTWTQVALLEKAQDVYRVDLQGKSVRAKFVRIERQVGPDGAKPNNGRLHMRNFLVYGRKLY